MDRQRWPLLSTYNWRVALREFAIVVTGVMAALAAQAWWESRENRRTERDYVLQLLADTRVNEKRLAESISRDSLSAFGASRALAALDGAGTPPPPDSFAVWIGWAASSTEFRPLIGTFQALLSTGDLRLIRNDSLRAAIVSYAAALENESERLRQIRGAVFDIIYPIGQSLPFIRAALLDGIRPERVNLTALRRDPNAAALMFTLQAAAVNRLSGLRSILEETLHMRRVLEEQPEARSSD